MESIPYVVCIIKYIHTADVYSKHQVRRINNYESVIKVCNTQCKLNEFEQKSM